MHVPVSCRLSAAGVRFSVIPFPPRDRPLLTVGPPTHTGPDPDGVTAFRTHELRPGWVPPIPRGRWCSPGRVASPTGTRRFPAASPSIPPTTSHRRSPLHEASNEGSRHSPGAAHCCARPPSEPCVRLSPHTAQASPTGSRADRSAGPCPRGRSARRGSWRGSDGGRIRPAVPCSHTAIWMIVSRAACQPLLPLARALRLLVDGQEPVPADRAAAILGFEEPSGWPWRSSGVASCVVARPSSRSGRGRPATPRS